MTKSAIDLMVEYLDSSASIGASRSENIRIAKRLQAEEKSKPAPVEAKATEEGSLVEKLNDILPIGTALCGECGGNGYVLEKSGMGEEQDPIACPDCHGRGLRNISELGYRPASPAVEELVRELREWSEHRVCTGFPYEKGYHDAQEKVDEIFAKYDNAKGGEIVWTNTRSG